MKEKLIVRGRLVTPADIVFIRSFIEKYHDKGRTFISKQLVEKLRCILPLPNLLSSLARRFACCQSCSVLLRTLWAYGFDSAAQRALEKSKVGEKEKTFFLQPNLLFKKVYRGNKEAREAIQRVANFSNYAIKWFRFIIFQKHSCLPQAGLRII